MSEPDPVSELLKNTLAADMGSGNLAKSYTGLSSFLVLNCDTRCVLRSGLRELYLIHSALIIYQLSLCVVTDMTSSPTDMGLNVQQSASQ